MCRSLFEAHKLLFSFLMTIKIMMGDDRVDALEWRFCISGQTIKPLSLENPAPDWIEARDAASSVILNVPGSAMPHFVTLSFPRRPTRGPKY